MKKEKKPAPGVNVLIDILRALVRTEPTCICCGCTMYQPCDVDGFGTGCSWVFLNKKTNEGICSGPRCMPKLAKKAGLY